MERLVLSSKPKSWSCFASEYLGGSPWPGDRASEQGRAGDISFVPCQDGLPQAPQLTPHMQWLWLWRNTALHGSSGHTNSGTLGFWKAFVVVFSGDPSQLMNVSTKKNLKWVLVPKYLKNEREKKVSIEEYSRIRSKDIWPVKSIQNQVNTQAYSWDNKNQWNQRWASHRL